jgi:hypothetical protein
MKPGIEEDSSKYLINLNQRVWNRSLVLLAGLLYDA